MDGVWKAFTLFIALVVAWIALQQWWINRERLRLDLFDRRYAVFESTRKFISEIVRDADFDHLQQQAFWTGTVDASFLFHSEVTEYIDLVLSKAVKLHYHLASQTARNEKHGEHIEAESELILWFAEQLRDDGLLRVLFGRYLRFQDLQGPLTVLLQRGANFLRRIWRKLTRQDRST